MNQMNVVKVPDMGEELICINSRPLEGNTIAPAVKEGESYALKNVHQCTCGQYHFDVGIKSTVNYVRCYTCKQELPNGHDIHWCHPIRFVK